MSRLVRLVLVFVLAGWASACEAPAQTPAAATAPAQSALRVVAVETFLADIAQNVAGDRVRVEALMPLGVDPHSFEPTPQDVKKVADSDLLIVNGAGLEDFLARLLSNAGSRAMVLEASKGLASRALKPGEPHDADNPGDPHFWLDPSQTVKYVENIRDGLSQADPEGAATYKRNADSYIAKLNALDEKIKQTVSAIPADKRKLVTDHDTFGYYSDRYGFEIVGMLVSSFSTADTSSAQQVAALIDQIRATGVKAIFLEQGTNPQLAEQIGKETGARIVTGLYTHSLSDVGGPAPNYLQMLEYDTQVIVDALK
jgi:ABC-type Zn uptake system ZnuABC Zn-binding protein ZnuA